MSNTVNTSLYSAEIINGKDPNGSAGFVYVSVTPGSNGGYVDILEKFNWNAAGGYVDEVPYVIAKEWELNFGQIISNTVALMDKFFNFAGNNNFTNDLDPNDPYAKIYGAHETGFTYVFPHLINSGASIRGKTTNVWKRNNIASAFTDFTGAVEGLIETAGSIIDFHSKKDPTTKDKDKEKKKINFGGLNKTGKFFQNEIVGSGLGLEDIVTYSSTNAKTLTISFPLYNTLDEKSAIENFDFVNLFQLQNLKMRTSFLSFIPPKIYTIESPGRGGIYMPAAFVSSFDVQSIGTTRFMHTGSYAGNAGTLNNSTYGRIIPEAYKVSITFEEIVPESSNIMLGSIGGNKVSVIDNTSASSKNAKQGVSVMLGKEVSVPNPNYKPSK